MEYSNENDHGWRRRAENREFSQVEYLTRRLQEAESIIRDLTRVEGLTPCGLLATARKWLEGKEEEWQLKSRSLPSGKIGSGNPKGLEWKILT